MTGEGRIDIVQQGSPKLVKFKNPDFLSAALNAEAGLRLLSYANDISLVVGDDGTIVDVAVAPTAEILDCAADWAGEKWLDTVTVESKDKIRDLLAPGGDDPPRWRQVNHPNGDVDIPVSYLAIPLDDDGTVLAVGRELHGVSELQQRLLDAQHSLERDYARLHQAEIRFRMLFSMSSEAILFVDADSRRIVEANPAAGDLLGMPANKLINRTFPRGFTDSSNDRIDELLVRVRAAGDAGTVNVTPPTADDSVTLHASLVRREEGNYFLIRMHAGARASDDRVTRSMTDIVNRSPDAFVLTDETGAILGGNVAFLNLTANASDMQMVGQPIDRWLGRRGIDVRLLLRNLTERGEIRRFDTVVYPEYGDPVEVELSAVSVLDSDDPCLGFVIRPRARNETDSGGGADELPHSLEDMAELVGRVPLKELVRETTDVIERMCIEAALKMTNQSRASAAEMLGLSRQSLYVKLNRYGLTDLDSDDD